MKKVTYLVCCVGLALQSCQSGQVKNENPFFNTYETPHEVPPFHLIKNQHYLPAYEEGMKQHQAEIDAIINNPEAPTFKNTIDALETSGELLNKSSLRVRQSTRCEHERFDQGHRQRDYPETHRSLGCDQFK